MSDLRSSPPVAHRTPDRRRAILMGILGVGLGISGAPSPLYGLYERHFSSGPVSVTVVFAAYAAGALAAVLVAGGLSDLHGRRALITVGSLGMVLGCVIFLLAPGVWALALARVVHGFSIGLLAVVAGAAVHDVAPERAAENGRDSGIVFSIGMGVSGLAVGLLAELAPAPLVTPWVLALVFAILALLGSCRLGETAPRRAGALAAPVAVPRVPETMRHIFLPAALGVFASWGALGLMLSVFPLMVSSEARISSAWASALVVGGVCAASALAQALSARRPAGGVAVAGDLALAVAIAASTGALASGSARLIAVATLLLGIGYGLSFSGSLRCLSAAMATAPTARGTVMSAYYLVAYAGLSVPSLVSSVALLHAGPVGVFGGIGVVLSATSCLAAWGGRQSRG